MDNKSTRRAGSERAILRASAAAVVVFPTPPFPPTNSRRTPLKRSIGRCSRSVGSDGKLIETERDEEESRRRDEAPGALDGDDNIRPTLPSACAPCGSSS